MMVINIIYIYMYMAIIKREGFGAEQKQTKRAVLLQATVRHPRVFLTFSTQMKNVLKTRGTRLETVSIHCL